jgi:TATA-binding protein-associated factor Taf7
MAKGKSAQDKRDIILDIFHTSKEPYQLKEIEKIATRKGVTSMTVQPILQTLIDDDLVKQDKIGTSNWFWSFPSEHAQKIEMRLEQLKQEIDTIEKVTEKTLLDIESEKETNKENDKENSVEERKNAELSLDEAKEENAKLLKELEKFADDNPEFNEQVTKGVKVAQVAADRWTDNLFLVKSWADKKFGDTEATKSLFKKEGIDLNSLDYPGA